MKLNIFTFIVIILFVGSCDHKKLSNEKPVITVSILPQKYFTEKIAGDKFNINVMIPPGASPASYEPTTKQMMDLANSIIYFKIGYIGFELNWINNMAADYPDVKFTNTSDGINFAKSEESHGDHKHHLIEPHIWMSPKNVRIIASNMLETIVQADSTNSDFYEGNYNLFISELDSIHAIIGSKLKSIKSRDFIIYHPALTYFAEDYGLTQHALEIDGKEPSVKQMKDVIKLAVDQDIKIIFVQKQFNQGEAKTLAKEINGLVIPIDPLDYDWNKQLLEIASILNENLK